MKSKIICLTPVLNEAWILDRFIQCASLWADYIIIADQGSTDGSVEIAQKYEKVILIDNRKEDDFNEYKMRAPLFEAARKIEGPKILISLDADEILTPNFDSLEWQTIRNSEPGTIVSIQVNNLQPDGSYWCLGDVWCGYNDDGAPYHSGTIHAPRSIMNSGSGHKVILCNDIQILHYHYMDKKRVQDKKRWYQCFELVSKQNDPITIFRRYNHITGGSNRNNHPIPDWWKTGYAKYDIEITSINFMPEHRWNNQILSYFEEYGARYFRHLNIWDVNWNDIASCLDFKHKNNFSDPRHNWEKAINRWLINTQGKQDKTGVRIMEKILRKIYR